MKKISFVLTAIIAMVLFVISCSEENYESDFADPESKLLTQFQKSNLEDNVIIVSGFEIDGSPIFELKDGWEMAWNNEFNKSFSLKPEDELCKGDGISFAKSVRNAVDSGKCVTIYKDSECTYHGVESECLEIIEPN